MIRPYPTGCALCGQQRFSGWVLVHGTYRVPMCSRHLDGATYGCIIGNVPPGVYLRRAGVVWRIEQEPQPVRRKRRRAK